jgi:hypothetical protein
MNHWITFLLDDFSEIDFIKDELDKLPFPLIDYTEGNLPSTHLSVCYNASQRDKVFLRTYCDTILNDSNTINYIVYGLGVIEYYDYIKDGIYK